MRQVTIHRMDRVDAATSNVLSPGIHKVEDLRNMLRHIESELPSMMHQPISSDITLNFYQYLSTHVLIVDGQFLLLTDVPIQKQHSSFKYMNFSFYQFHIITCQLSKRLIIIT